MCASTHTAVREQAHAAAPGSKLGMLARALTLQEQEMAALEVRTLQCQCLLFVGVQQVACWSRRWRRLRCAVLMKRHTQFFACLYRAQAYSIQLSTSEPNPHQPAQVIGAAALLGYAQVYDSFEGALRDVGAAAAGAAEHYLAER